MKPKHRVSPGGATPASRRQMAPGAGLEVLLGLLSSESPGPELLHASPVPGTRLKIRAVRNLPWDQFPQSVAAPRKSSPVASAWRAASEAWVPVPSPSWKTPQGRSTEPSRDGVCEERFLLEFLAICREGLSSGRAGAPSFPHSRSLTGCAAHPRLPCTLTLSRIHQAADRDRLFPGFE